MPDTAVSRQKHWWRPSLFAGISASIGALVASYAQSGHFYIVPAGISYLDLAAILLSAVGVIVAIFGGVLAIAAFWGFAQMKREAVQSATEAALKELMEQIENGPTRHYILEEIERLIISEFNSGHMDKRIQARIDRIAMGIPEDKLLENEKVEGDP